MKNFLEVCRYGGGLLGLNSCQFPNFPVQKVNSLKPICALTPCILQINLVQLEDPLVSALNLLYDVKIQAFPDQRIQAEHKQQW